MTILKLYKKIDPCLLSIEIYASELELQGLHRRSHLSSIITSQPQPAPLAAAVCLRCSAPPVVVALHRSSIRCRYANPESAINGVGSFAWSTDWFGASSRMKSKLRLFKHTLNFSFEKKNLKSQPMID
ncbi:unnamed protein product [Cuscuta europaea]|uniref:Uncharacterized protein n=1 Tax=Cuscuta europaea TaxID=41803 RepID=A0A9P0ZEE8_CUSEU|nr:unnamed protein product [Cuscuta europaea]